MTLAPVLRAMRAIHTSSSGAVHAGAAAAAATMPPRAAASGVRPSASLLAPHIAGAVRSSTTSSSGGIASSSGRALMTTRMDALPRPSSGVVLGHRLRHPQQQQQPLRRAGISSSGAAAAAAGVGVAEAATAAAAAGSGSGSGADGGGEGALATPRARKEFKPRLSIRELLREGAAAPVPVGGRVEIAGWVRSVRDQKALAFVTVNDGSNLSGIQVVVDASAPGFDLVSSGAVATGAAVRVAGTLTASRGAKQAVEITAEGIELVGACDPGAYPLQKKRHSLEFLRGIAHLRPRTNTIGAVSRVRSALAHATHSFFGGAGFQLVHTPILSASDCEGAGEMFQVTTLLNGVESANGNGGNGAPPPSEGELEAARSAVASQGAAVKAAKDAAKAGGGDGGKPSKAAVDEAVRQLLALKEKLAAMEAAATAPSGGALPRGPDGAIDYAGDFFGRKAYLTVSGQLNGEMYACALGDIYTFGPTFRAENSNTARHLAEFWMIEPEIAFATLEDDMALAEAYIKATTRHILEHCAEDLAFFDSMVEKGLIARLQDVVEKPFATVTYTEAVKLLQKSGHKFEYPVKWGADLQSEHERFLTEQVFDRTPLIVTDYPADIKAFYMRRNDDGKTVAAMDVLVPRVGELIGGSQREERLDVLETRMRESGLDPADYSPYLDLRRYGTQPHAGFGLGFERLVQFSTGVENIRDVIPFPRYPGHCAF